MNALEVLKYGHLTVLGTVEAVPEHLWDEPDVCGVWPSKGVIAHLASFELAFVDVLIECAGGGPTPYLDAFRAGGSFNDDEVARRLALPPAEVIREYTEAHEHSMDLAREVPRGRWSEPGTLPWYGMEYSLDDLVVYQYYGHKREHTAQIAAFLDRVARGVTVDGTAGRATSQG
ncbi:MAG: hypothetical protein GEU80_04370 [Dehalococcoidia bacterium]|nr:hypothetical protein [Dehalococcoidia bacterium]